MRSRFQKKKMFFCCQCLAFPKHNPPLPECTPMQEIPCWTKQPIRVRLCFQIQISASQNSTQVTGHYLPRTWNESKVWQRLLGTPARASVAYPTLAATMREEHTVQFSISATDRFTMSAFILVRSVLKIRNYSCIRFDTLTGDSVLTTSMQFLHSS